MGVRPVEQSPEIRGDSGSSKSSVTQVGEPSLVRASALDIARGSVLAGRYQIEAIIGKGGSGIVLRAFDRVAQVPVAVKLLKPELAMDPRWIDRFSRELRLARQIQHPNVCRVFDIGQADGHWFITMELATNGTLRDDLGERATGRSLDDKVADVRAVVAGLAAIHAAGIVHRDVKPDNFLRLVDGRLVLSDFGLATNPADAPAVSILVGTPHYMAPEVVMGDVASTRSDVWAAAVVVYEILTGARPDRGTLTRGPSDLVPANAPRTVKALLEVCERSLAVEPDERPTDGTALAAAFDGATAAERPPARRELLSTRRGRARLTWALTIGALGVATVGALVGGRLWRPVSAGSRIAWQEGPKTTTIAGAGADWTRTMDISASLHEHVHCMSWKVPDKVLQLIVGTPRRALELDVRSKMQRPALLDGSTFSVGCPQRSSQGALLFERLGDNGRHELALTTDDENAHDAKMLTPGSDPAWLPSGNEFIYTADDTHAAIFSVPVMTADILSESPKDGGLLVDKAVAKDGRSLALRYLDNALKVHVVVHELPSLTVTSSNLFNEHLADLEFLPKGHALLFSTDGGGGRLLGAFTPGTPSAVLLGEVSGRILSMPRSGHDSIAVVSWTLESDVWTYENGRRATRLTTDGHSYYPDLSINGDLLVEHLSPNGETTIQLSRGKSAPLPMTVGPRDFTPQFLPDGTSWLYVDGQRQAIRKCDLAGTCQDWLVTTDFPFSPVASPNGRMVAFLTIVGRNRLKVVDDRGATRDLGAARPECSPRWESDSRIWILQGTDRSPVWAQRDAATGAQLTTIPIAESPRRDTRECPFLSEPAGRRPSQRVSTWTREETEIGLLPDQQGYTNGQNP